MNDMAITVRYDRESLLGPESAEEQGIDEDALFVAYEEAIEKAIHEAYPQATVNIIGPEPYAGLGVHTAEWLPDLGQPFWGEDPDTTEHVAAIVNDVYEAGTFWRMQEEVGDHDDQ